MSEGEEIRSASESHATDSHKQAEGGIGNLVDLAKGVVDSTIDQPATGVGQIFNHKMTPVDLSGSFNQDSLAAKAGSLGGSIVEFAGLTKLVGGGAVGSTLRKAKLADEGLFASTAKMSATGATYGGIFQPSDADNFWEQRSKHSLISGATFGTMGAAYDRLGHVNLLGKSGERNIAQNAAMGGLSGLPGGLVSGTLDHALINRQSGIGDIAKTTGYYGLFGAGMSGAFGGIDRLLAGRAASAKEDIPEAMKVPATEKPSAVEKAPAAEKAPPKEDIPWSVKDAEGIVKPVEALKPGDHNINLNVEGQERSFQAHVPAGYDGKQPLPVMFVLHGLSSEKLVADMPKMTGMNKRADAEKFITVYPQAIRDDNPFKVISWNSNGVMKEPAAGYDDVNYIKAIVDTLPQHAKIDPSKMALIGFSEGGTFVHQLAAKLPGRFQTIGAVGSTAFDNVKPVDMANPKGDYEVVENYQHAIPPVQDNSPQKVFLVHNTKDKHFMPYLSDQPAAAAARTVPDHIWSAGPPLQENHYINANGYKQLVVLPETNPDISGKMYLDGKNGSQLANYIVAGEHAWHGKEGYPGKAGTKPHPDFSVSDEFVNFWLKDGGVDLNKPPESTRSSTQTKPVEETKDLENA